MYCYCPEPHFYGHYGVVSQNCPSNTVATVKSEAKPKAFQSNRSSDNFKVPQDGTYRLITDSNCMFMIGKDVFGSDEFFNQKFSANSEVYLQKGDKYYIANPSDAYHYGQPCKAAFTVCVVPK